MYQQQQQNNNDNKSKVFDFLVLFFFFFFTLKTSSFLSVLNGPKRVLGASSHDLTLKKKKLEATVINRRVTYEALGSVF